MSADKLAGLGSLLALTIVGALATAAELCDGNLRVLALMAIALSAAIVLTACEVSR